MNMRRLFRAALLASVLTTAAACGGTDPEPNPAEAPSATTPLDLPPPKGDPLKPAPDSPVSPPTEFGAAVDAGSSPSGGG